jgi:hypothetical protein
VKQYDVGLEGNGEFGRSGNSKEIAEHRAFSMTVKAQKRPNGLLRGQLGLIT